MLQMLWQVSHPSMPIKAIIWTSLYMPNEMLPPHESETTWLTLMNYTNNSTLTSLTCKSNTLHLLINVGLHHRTLRLVTNLHQIRQYLYHLTIKEACWEIPRSFWDPSSGRFHFLHPPPPQLHAWHPLHLPCLHVRALRPQWVPKSNWNSASAHHHQWRNRIWDLRNIRLQDRQMPQMQTSVPSQMV